MNEEKKTKKRETNIPNNDTQLPIQTTKLNSLRKISSILSLRAPSDVVIQATQLGLSFSLAKIATEAVRDILKEDFFRIDIYYFPTTGSSTDHTPPHGFHDFRFKDYAPGAFRFFRTFFGIETRDFTHSLCDKAMKELSRSGASGSLFYKSSDDVYVVKTVDEREAKFLQSLLVGYYMNLAQNKNTLLPKFFGLYLYSSLSQHFRFVVMNNLVPSYLKFDETYDIKGSTFKRRAKVKNNTNSSPLFKDLDFLDRHRNGLILDPQYYSLLISTIERDARVLSSFKIMDYSLLIAVHNISAHDSSDCPCVNLYPGGSRYNTYRKTEDLSYELRGLATKGVEGSSFNYQGGIPAKNDKGEDLLLFIGIIDILQDYRLSKRLEHRFKSIVTDGRTISVSNPKFYQKRFLDFCKQKIFRCSDVKPGEVMDACLGGFSLPVPHTANTNFITAEELFQKPIFPLKTQPVVGVSENNVNNDDETKCNNRKSSPDSEPEQHASD